MEKNEGIEQTSVRLIEALAKVWSKIRERHPDVPGVVLLAAPAHRDQLNVLGHFAALRWRRRQVAEAELHEVVVIAEHLDRPAEEIVETLIHEAAHALNFERGLRDCTASQYHNRAFRNAALELGLTVEQVKHYGYAKTSLPKTTAALYVGVIEALRDVLAHRHRIIILPGKGGTGATGSDDDEGGDDKPSSRSRKATCKCPYIIRVAKKTMEETTIRCETCGEAFRLT